METCNLNFGRMAARRPGFGRVTHFDDFLGAKRLQTHRSESTDSPSTPKRQRRQTHNDTNADISDTVEAKFNPSYIGSSGSDRPSVSPITPTSNDQIIEIKTEDQISQLVYEQEIEGRHRVKIFVGPNNAEIHASKIDLEKSSVLYPMITEDEHIGSFIMHPILRHVSVEDFLPLLEFIRYSDYKPRIIGSEVQCKELEGLLTTEQYSHELIRSGKLYRLAQRYKVIGMPDKIFEKVTEAQFRPYSLPSIIELACLIFQLDYEVGLPMTRTGGEAETGHHECTNEYFNDPFEDWIVEALASNHKAIMRSDVEHELFWKLEKISSHRRLIADVYERCAKQYRRQGVFPSDIIEVD